MEEEGLCSDSEAGGEFDGTEDRCQAPVGQQCGRPPSPIKAWDSFFLQLQQWEDKEEEEVQEG